jgi:hypothetical protein
MWYGGKNFWANMFKHRNTWNCWDHLVVDRDSSLYGACGSLILCTKKHYLGMDITPTLDCITVSCCFDSGKSEIVDGHWEPVWIERGYKHVVTDKAEIARALDNLYAFLKETSDYWNIHPLLRGRGMKPFDAVSLMIDGCEHTLYMSHVISKNNPYDFPKGWIIIECSGFERLYHCKGKAEKQRILADSKTYANEISKYWRKKK